MEDTFYKRFGNGPFPFPVEKLDEFLEYHDSKVLNVCLSKTEIIFKDNDDFHSHDTYEFIIPSDPMPFTRVGDKSISLPPNNILPINPSEIHGPKGTMRVNRIIGSHIDKEFLNDIASELFNINDFIFKNEPLIPNTQVKHLMEQFIQEARVKQAGHQFILECLSTQLVINILRLEKNQTHDESSYKYNVKDNIYKVIEFLKENYNSDNYSTKEIANIANLSTYHFIRAFKNEIGKTPYEYLMDIKIEKAKQMLKNKNFSITDICYLCGFTNHSHFSTIFKKKLGISPSKYRNL